MSLTKKTILICALLAPLVLSATGKDEVQEIEAPVEVVVEEIVTVEEIVPVPEPTYSYTVADFKKYASERVSNEWGSNHVDSFIQIIHKESSWRVNTAHYSNGKSSAYGFGGFLNATWATVGCTKTSDQFKQIDCTIKYISQRYGNPNNALSFHNSRGWY